MAATLIAASGGVTTGGGGMSMWYWYQILFNLTSSFLYCYSLVDTYYLHYLLCCCWCWFLLLFHNTTGCSCTALLRPRPVMKRPVSAAPLRTWLPHCCLVEQLPRYTYPALQHLIAHLGWRLTFRKFCRSAVTCTWRRGWRGVADWATIWRRYLRSEHAEQRCGGVLERFYRSVGALTLIGFLPFPTRWTTIQTVGRVLCSRLQNSIRLPTILKLDCAPVVSYLFCVYLLPIILRYSILLLYTFPSYYPLFNTI